jgi:prephenate dehydratase
VPGTLDELVFGSTGVFIRREVVVPVTFVLAGLPGVREAGLRTALSHPHGLAQCRRVVAELGLDVELSSSTSQACTDVVERRDPALAAICSAQAAEVSGLQVLRTAVEDTPGARTRLGLIGRTLAAPSGQDVTLAVLTPDTNRTGVLAETLRCFADRGVALSRVSSRPLKAQLGTYCFIVAAQGHLADEVVSDALAAVAGLGVAVKVLGSYAETAPVVTMEVGGSLPPGSVDAQGWGGWRDAVVSACT